MDTRCAIGLTSSTSTAVFREMFDHSAFEFLHSLHGSPHFTFPALIDLARRFSKHSGRFYVEEGETTPAKGWTISPPNKPLVESLMEIEATHSFVMLKRVHEDPEYAPFLHACMIELSELTGFDMRKNYRDGLMTILITSPFRVTPYHIDSEANLLMQISGAKTVYVFDGHDRQVLPVTELEQFWSGNIKAAVYKAHAQDHAKRFELAPGIGVCNPVVFPHWVKNGSNVSVSVSINFKRVTDDVADAFRLNARLRKIGLHPIDPGKSHTVDHAKGLVYRTLKNVKHSVDELRTKSH